MQVIAGGITGGAHITNGIPGVHRGSFGRAQFAHMGVKRGQAAAMVDNHIIAIGCAAAGDNHRARLGRHDGRAVGRRDIHARMQLILACDGMFAVAEPAGHPPVAAGQREGIAAAGLDRRHALIALTA